MSDIRGLSIPEKIVWLFEYRVTEAHRATLYLPPLSIEVEQFDETIATARDLGVARGLRLTPIYEREGWWTAEPSRRIAARALYESLRRNQGEQERNARVYSGFGRVGDIAQTAEMATRGTRNVAEVEIPELSKPSQAQNDYVLERVDLAVAARKGYVARIET
jgi:hypothetical protein